MIAAYPQGFRLPDTREGDLPQGIAPGAFWKVLDDDGAPKIKTHPGKLTEECWRAVVPVGDKGVDWAHDLVFPGLRRGEKLTRKLALPPRADLLARDGTPFSKLPDIAPDVVGDIGPMPADDVARLEDLDSVAGLLQPVGGGEAGGA